MSYVDQNLMSGESIVYRTRLHWIIFLAPLVVLGFYIMIGVDRAVREPGVESRTLDALGLVGLLSLLASIAMFFSSEFAVTNKRVILKEGFLRRRSLEILLTKVEAIGVEQSLLGRYLDYGSLIVGGSGGTKEVFHPIWSPLAFRRKVQEQASAATDTSA
jgi:uncharacterized membrane protein YdbT with pleckstrin-like domain